MSLEKDVEDYLYTLDDDELVALYNEAVGYPVDYIYPMEEFDNVMQQFNFSMIDVANIATSFFYKEDFWFTLNGGDELVSYASVDEGELLENVIHRIVEAVKDRSSLGDIEIQQILAQY